MFGFLKNKMLEIGYSDLDVCLFFLKYESSFICGVQERIVWAVFMNFNHIISKVLAGEVTILEANEVYTKRKNKIMIQKGLKNHKDSEFCEAYIILCFLTSIAKKDLVYAKNQGLKIIDFFENNVSHIDGEENINVEKTCATFRSFLL